MKRIKTIQDDIKRLGKQGVDENAALKSFLHVVAQEAHELVHAERSDSYPYEFEHACDELEYKSRDGFIPNSYNHGGFSIKVFETVDLIQGSGTYPSSTAASDKIREAGELNRKYALEELKLTEEQLTDESLAEKVYEKQSELGQDDTIQFEVTLMYHGTERGIHSATVTVGINWESPYHRSSSAFARCVGRGGYETETFIETEVTWRTNRSGRPKLLKAVKDGIKKLF
jgi:hypothetical protein